VIGTVPLTGSRTVYPTTTTTYTLEAGNEAGSITDTVTVTVSPLPLPVINSFTADPPSITAGDSSELSWSVSGATEVTIDPLTGPFGLAEGTRTVSPTTTTTYTLEASNEAGTITATFEVVVITIPVINSFTADPTSVILNVESSDSFTLSWSVSGATAVTIDQGIGSVGPTGTRTLSPTSLGLTTYTLEASNEAGSSTATAQVFASLKVILLPFINSFTADPTSILEGDSSTLRWDVSNADTVTIDPEPGSVTPPTTGSCTVDPPTTTMCSTTTTYTLEASNEAGSSTATVQVTVISLPIIEYFTASPPCFPMGGDSRLDWRVSCADFATIDQGIGNVWLIGMRIVSPNIATTYTLTASNEVGSSTATVQVTVGCW